MQSPTGQRIEMAFAKLKALIRKAAARSYDQLRKAVGHVCDLVIPPFLTGCIRRTYATIFSFCAGVMPPMPRCPAMVCLQTMKGMFGRSLL